MDNVKRTVYVHHSVGEYEITCQSGVFEHSYEIISKKNDYDKMFILTDTNIDSIYGKKIRQIFKDAYIFAFPAGESSKNLSTIQSIYEEMHKAGLTRHSAGIAIGGGVCGDMCGFACSTYLRGISFFQIPTSLLAMVDSSIGGKTGVDTEWGKNLIGAFYQPTAVICDPDFLKTLSDDFYKDGMGEVIKSAFIYDKALLELLSEPNTDICKIIYRCIKIKADVVTKDEKETELRAILNFGHTVAHAIEKCENYSGLTHGKAVCVGMVYANIIGEKLGITPHSVSLKLLEILSLYDLPNKTNLSADKLVKVIMNDKKRMAEAVKFVFLRDIAKTEFAFLDKSQILDLLPSGEELPA